MIANRDSLQQLREKINEIDQQLLELFHKRMQVARAVGSFKLGTEKAVYDAAREEQKLADVRKHCHTVDNLRAQSFLAALMRLSRGAQYDLLRAKDDKVKAWQLYGDDVVAALPVKKVVYQGAIGSYSSQASRLLYPHAQTLTAANFAAACRLVADGTVDVAVLPLENTTAGTVDDVYDLLIEYNLSIRESLTIPIRHHLLGLAGANVSAIKTVVSHPQALAQCSDIISKYGWKSKESLNTAYAAALVKRKDNTTIAAIASEEAAAAQGLQVLLSDLQDTDYNQTRFIAVGRKTVISANADRLSLVLKLPHKSGSLASTLAILADRGLNLSKIQSRPIARQPWSYLFYLDVDCTANDEEALSALYQLSQEMPYFKFLGWYREKSLAELSKNSDKKNIDKD